MSEAPVSTLLLLLLAAAPGYAETGTNRILERADAATSAVTSVAYAVKAAYPESLPGVPRDLQGQVTIESGAEGERPRFRIDATFIPPGSEDTRHLVAASDGQVAAVIDHTRRTYTRGDPTEVAPQMWSVKPLLMPEYHRLRPFREEIEGTTVEHKGVELVGDVPCDVIRVVYDLPKPQEAHWYFGREDSLPRRVDRLTPTGPVTFLLTDLDVDPTVDGDTYRPPRPEGYEELAPTGRRY